MKKRVHRNDKKIYLETLKSVLGRPIFHYYCPRGKFPPNPKTNPNPNPNQGQFSWGGNCPDTAFIMRFLYLTDRLNKVRTKLKNGIKSFEMIQIQNIEQKK